jgi:cyclopropane fatty-acyl-phospholipid synthase-like methyltransferase
MRLYNQKVDIDHDKIKSFFDKRAKNVDKDSILSSTMFTQEEIAQKRDLIEKKIFLENINVKDKFKILDIGCGVGRWAELFLENSTYLGLDYSNELLNLAKENNPSTNVHFQLMSADDIDPNELLINPPFDLIIMTGLLIYINDAQLKKVFNSINELSTEGTIFYLREPVATKERLTLKEFYSEELEEDYSAIYRTESEYFELFSLLDGFNLLKSGDPYDKSVHHRAETIHKYYIFRRV